jgi:hypothetical protein
MPDIADLVARARTEGVETTAKELRGLSAAGRSAETSVESLSSAARGTAGPLRAMNANIAQQQRTLNMARGAMGLTNNETLNLGRQFADVSVSLASGQAIWMVAIQQGAQIGEVFAEARQRGVGFGDALGDLFEKSRKVLGVLAPLGLAAAAFGGAFALASRSIMKDIGDVRDEMGLTQDQLKQLKEDGVSTTVTMGDAWRALGTTIKEMLQSVFGDQLAWADTQWNKLLDDLTTNTAREVDTILGVFVGAYRGVVATWNNFPDVMADLTAMAANWGSRHMNEFVKNSVKELNALRTAWNAWAMVTGNPGRIPEIRAPESLRLATNRASNGAVANVGAEISSGYRSMQGATSRFVGEWGENAEASSIARVRSELDDAADSAGRAAKKAKEAREELIGFARTDLSPLRGAMFDIVTPLEEMADQLRVIDNLTRDLSVGLSSAFGEGGDALGDMLSTLTGYRAQMAAWQDEQRKMSEEGAMDFLRMREIEAERGQAQIAVYGDLARAARGYFEEGSTGYQILLTIEQLYRAQQLAGMLMAMATGKAETASSVAGSMARGSASMASAAASMFERLGPLAFPAVAAMLGLLAGLGLRGSGGGGRYSPANDNDPAETMRSQTSQLAQTRAQAMEAQRVQVMVSADRDGMYAYVAQTAREEAAPIAKAEGARAVSTSTRIVRKSAPGMQQRTARLGTS